MIVALRAPQAPRGWPIAIAPPLSLTFARVWALTPPLPALLELVEPFVVQAERRKKQEQNAPEDETAMVAVDGGPHEKGRRQRPG